MDPKPMFASQPNPANPFDFGSAAGGPNPEKVDAFNTAINAWYQHRDVELADAMSKLDAAVAAMKSWAPVINNILNIMQSYLPLHAPTTPDVENNLQGLYAQRQNIQQILEMLSQAQSVIPGTARTINTLVANLQALRGH